MDEEKSTNGKATIMPRIKLFLLGSPHIEVEESPVEIQRRKVKALLIYLAVTGQRHQRERLAALLWPIAIPNS
jgi:DNA-binding SARP family transcriptional activator